MPEQDGNLVMEFMYTELYTLLSIENGDLSAYTCAVEQYKFLACLDIAGPATLSGTVEESSVALIDTEEELLDFLTTPYNTTVTDHLFGIDQPCEGSVVGDYQISGLDMLVLMYIQFRVSPYNRVLGSTFTVHGESDVGGRCIDNITTAEFNAQYDPSNPCIVPSNRRSVGRRLEYVHEYDMKTTIHHHYKDPERRGSWFHIHVDSNLLAVELFLGGTTASGEVRLSNRRAPWNLTTATASELEPLRADEHEVRFVRQAEFFTDEVPVGECAFVQGLLAGNGMYRNTISVGQVPTHDSYDLHMNSQVCPFDIFVWTPNVLDCDISLNAGSRAIDGAGGKRLTRDVRCDPNMFDFASLYSQGRSSIPPPPAVPLSPPLPAAPLSPPPVTPFRTNDDETAAAPALIGSSVALLVGLGCLGVMLYRRRRNREQQTASPDQVVVRTSGAPILRKLDVTDLSTARHAGSMAQTRYVPQKAGAQAIPSMREKRA